MAKRDKTIFDIAEALNISASTVSRALQGSILQGLPRFCHALI